MPIVRIPLLMVFLAALLSGCASSNGAARPAEPSKEFKGPPRIEVTRARLLVEGQFLEVNFRMFGMQRYDPEPDSTYLIDQTTGEKFYITWLRRIGRMASTKANTDGSNQYILFKNREGKLKTGAKVTVVVGAARQENVLVEAQ